MAEAPTPQGLLNNQSFGTIAPYEPNMVERAQGLLAQGLIKFGYDPRDAYVEANKIINTQGDVGAADFTPLAGDLIGAQDSYDMGVDAKRAFERDEYLKALGYGAGSAATAVLSGLGVFGTIAPPVDKAIDAARVGVKKATRLLDNGDNIVTGADRDANFKNWFGDSKVVDEAGEPLTVYHGSPDNFDAFDPRTIGNRGSAEGYGFYFTDAEDIAKGYTGSGSGNLIEANLSLQKPLNSKAKPFSNDEMEKIIDRLVDIEVSTYPDELNDFKDGFLSNFVDTYSGIDKETAVKQAVNMLDDNDIAIDQIAELANIYGEKTGALKAVRDALGYDGIHTKNFQDSGNDVFLAWFPEQIKSIHNRGTYDPKDANILKGIAPIAGAGLLGAGMMQQEEQQPQQGILN